MSKTDRQDQNRYDIISINLYKANFVLGHVGRERKPFPSTSTLLIFQSVDNSTRNQFWSAKLRWMLTTSIGRWTMIHTINLCSYSCLNLGKWMDWGWKSKYTEQAILSPIKLNGLISKYTYMPRIVLLKYLSNQIALLSKKTLQVYCNAKIIQWFRSVLFLGYINRWPWQHHCIANK